MSTYEIFLSIVTVTAGISLVVWLITRRPPPPPAPSPVHDDRPTMAEFTTALAALERSQAATLAAIASQSLASQEHLERVVTKIVMPSGPATPAEDAAPWEGTLDPEDPTIIPGREASDDWISDDALVDPFAPPAGLPLPPMPGVQPPDNFGGA